MPVQTGNLGKQTYSLINPTGSPRRKTLEDKKQKQKRRNHNKKKKKPTKAKNTSPYVSRDKRTSPNLV